MDKNSEEKFIKFLEKNGELIFSEIDKIIDDVIGDSDVDRAIVLMLVIMKMTQIPGGYSPRINRMVFEICYRYFATVEGLIKDIK